MKYDLEKMEDHFVKRTEKHISLVEKWFNKIEEFTKEGDKIKDHDNSKFSEPELTPYLYINWSYKNKGEGIDFEVPDYIKEKMNTATIHHIKNNKHHPEYWDDNFDESKFNFENRDEIPEEMVDARAMPDRYIKEMVADWFAIAEERKTDPRKWAEKNINKRWKFLPTQKDLIYKIIEEVWEK